MDEPTQLPEGFEIELAPVDRPEQLTDEERARLHTILDESLAQDDADETFSEDEVMAELRAKR